jgi:hypothetical protein
MLAGAEFLGNERANVTWAQFTSLSGEVGTGSPSGRRAGQDNHGKNRANSNFDF